MHNLFVLANLKILRKVRKNCETGTFRKSSEWFRRQIASLKKQFPQVAGTVDKGKEMMIYNIRSTNSQTYCVFKSSWLTQTKEVV